MSHVSVGVMKGAWVKVGVTQKKGSDYKSGGRFLRRNQSCWKMKKTERTLKSRTNQRCLCTIVLFLFVGSTQTHTHTLRHSFFHTHTHTHTQSNGCVLYNTHKHKFVCTFSTTRSESLVTRREQSALICGRSRRVSCVCEEL